MQCNEHLYCNVHYTKVSKVVIEILTCITLIYKDSIFPQAIRDWNVLPESVISSVVFADDCVTEFTSLVRARD